MTAPLDKTALRSRLLRVRAAVAPELRDRAARVLAAAGLDLVARQAPSAVPVVSAYHPMRGEADPLPMLDALAASGIATALPLTVARATPLRFAAWRPGEPLRAGRYGVLEPPAGASAVEPDILFIPLLGFDARGFRLGYGAGYYDATLAALRRRKRVLALGVAVSAQEIDCVPTEPHDERLDGVVTEHGLRPFGIP